MSGWLRGIILGAIAAAGADVLWQRARHDMVKGPQPPTDTNEVVGAAAAGGALAGLWSWTRGGRRR